MTKLNKTKLIITAITAVLIALFVLPGCNDNPKETNETKEPEKTVELKGKLLILQAYGSSDTAAGATHSFVELYNISDKEIDLKSVYLYYADGIRGQNITEDSHWARIQLTGKVPAKSSFLILGPNQESTNARYVIEEIHGENYGDVNERSFTLNNRSFKVALIQGDAILNTQNPFNIDGEGTEIKGYIDMAGAANDPNNAANPDNIFGFETAPARCSASEAIRRKNLTDTNNNSVDFIAARYGATSGNNISLTDEEFEVRYPRNSRAGSWDPFTEPAVPEPTTAGEISEYAGKLLILQAGAATDGAITRSFAELYNNTDNTINLSAFSLQYGAAGANWTMIKLTGNIQAKSSYLIRGALGTVTNDSRLYIDSADLTVSSFNLSNQGYKIALMENQNKLTVINPFSMTEGKAAKYVDMLGAYNSSAGSVDAFETTVFNPISKQAAARRKSLVDTDDNSKDFERIDYRRVSGNNGISDDNAARYRPRSSADGAWDPVSEPEWNVRPPVFSHNSGLYAQPFALTLTSGAGNVIYYSIDGSIPDPSKASTGGPVYRYTSPITVQNRDGQPNLLATYENSKKMYGDPNDSRGHMPSPYYPSNTQVPKATVIRAISVNTIGTKSDSMISSYFIGGNLDSYQNHPVISFVTDPYNLMDNNYGIYVRGEEYKRWPNYNFCMKGTEWEREVFLELFNAQRKVPVSTGAGIRIRGGWSRDKGQKSFNVYFREEYGINNLKDYNLIPGAAQSDGMPVSTYKSFMLRNGGNDTDYTKFYDAFIQSVISGRNITTQAAIPCVVYINGEYWGPYNLQERYSDNHTEYKYGVNRNNVISYDNGEIDDGLPEDGALYWDMISYKDKDLSVKSIYDTFCNIFDIQSFIDYFASQIYVNNEDWPHNNYRLWRTRTIETGNPYGDGKWRWSLFDTEYAMGIYSGGGINDPFGRVLGGDHHHNQLFKKLMTNNDFCKQFVITMMDLLNVNFHPDNVIPKLDEIARTYSPLMEGYFERWGRPWWSVFENKVNDAKKYLNDIRPAMINNYLPGYFGKIGISAGNTAAVTLNAKNNGAIIPNASIKINTSTVKTDAGNWIGQYYSALPVTVTAVIPDGYEFVNWTVSGGTAVSPADTTTAVNFSGNVTITANYILK